VLLLGLFVAWKTDPTLSIGVRMGVGDWKTSSRYNALHLSNVIPQPVHKLHELGMIQLSKGGYFKAGARSNRTTRIMAATPLIALFEQHDLELAELEPPRERELVVLRDGKNRDIEYHDTPQTNLWRAALRAYNELLWETFIDLPDFEQPYVVRPIRAGARQGDEQRIAICGNDFAVRRVFSRGNWESNGRFFGGWWQQMSKDIRKHLHINNEATVVIDFKGMHIAVLSKERGHPIVGDPYSLHKRAMPEDVQDKRSTLKQLILTAINARSAKAAYQAFREGQPHGSREASLTNRELPAAIDVFVEKHPHLKECLFADEGIRLMHLDSRVAYSVINRLTTQRVPVLCIHDSFIVAASHQALLQQEMDRAATFVFGAPLKTETTVGYRIHDPDYDDPDPLPNHLTATAGYRRRSAWARRQSAQAPEEELY